MEKKVTVLTPNCRRQTIKLSTPNTTLLQILEEVCVKHGLNSDDYCLTFHNKEVGLTQMFRFSGLPNNCLLEMKEAERKREVASNVDICIQLEDGSRKQGQFTPNDNLWHVVEQLTTEVCKNYSSPVAIYMRQDVIGQEKMSSTTLKSLGITEGRAMIRVINKNPEELKIQANVYVAPTVKDKPENDNEELNARNKKTTGAGGFAITKDLVQSLKKSNNVDAYAARETAAEDDEHEEKTESAPEKPKPAYVWGTGTGYSIRDRSETEVAAEEAAERAERERLEAEMEVEPEVNIIGERNALIYSLDATQKRLEDLPDSFFDLTVHDLKLVLRDLKKVAAGNADAPLLTEKLRELQENKTMLNKMAQYKNCVIRIQFPNRYVLQGMFKPIDKVSNVIEFVRKFLHNADSKFYLFTIPPKTILPLDKTLLELDFVPTAVIHFALEEETENGLSSSTSDLNLIKPEFLEKLTSVEGAIFAANKFRISNPRSPTHDALVTDEEDISKEEQKSPDASRGAIPKRPRNDDMRQKT